MGIGVSGSEVSLCGVGCAVPADDGMVVWVSSCVNAEKVCVTGVIDTRWCDVMVPGLNWGVFHDAAPSDLFHGVWSGEVVSVLVSVGGRTVFVVSTAREEDMFFSFLVGTTLSD